MKKSFIKALALVLAVLMLMTAVPMGVFATDPPCAHASITKISAKAASSSGHGYIACWKCNSCGKYSINSDPFTALDEESVIVHYFAPDNEYVLDDSNKDKLKSEATCKTGNVYYKKCKHCDVYSDSLTFEDDARVAHTPADEWTVPTGADCETADFTKRLLCTVCGEDAVEPILIKKGEHEEDPRPDIEPTCQKEGHKAGIYCTKCCKYLPGQGGEPIAKKPHDVQLLKKGTPATCTEPGTEDVKICIMCHGKDTLVGGKMSDNGEITANVITKLGHNVKDVTAKPKTCLEDGYKMDARICVRCGLSLSPQGADVLDKAPGFHVYEEVPAKAALTTSQGCKKHWECKQSKDKDNNTIVEYFTRPTKTVTVNGQQTQAYITVKDAEAAHYTLNDGIYVYQQVNKDDVIIPALPHDHQWRVDQDKSYAKTCVKDGLQVTYCEMCGEEVETVLTATGHKWECVTIIEATCTKEGTMMQKCSVCQAEGASAPKAKTAHDWEQIETADCTKGGTAKFKCRVCQTEEVKQVTKRDSHIDANNDGICDECGTQFCKCICHNQKWYGKLLYYFVKIWWQYLGMKEKCECGAVHYTKATTTDIPSVTG